MKQIIDSSGNKIKGLFRQDNGSLVVIDEHGYMKSKLSIGVVDRLNSEVSELREQLMTVMRVKDQSGNIVNNMDRAKSGGHGYAKYMIEKHKTADVEQMREELAQLRTMVLLMSKKYGIPTL